MSKEATITIDLPVAPPGPGYQQTHVAVQGLSKDEAAAFEAIRAGLAANPKRMAPRETGEPGRMVNHEQGSDVLRWILQQVAQQLKAG